MATPNPTLPPEFGLAIENYYELLTDSPVDNQAFVEASTVLEHTGLRAVHTKDITMQYFANEMHQALAKVAGVEVVPPFREEQVQLHAGKLALYAKAVEVDQPKRRRRAARATDTTGLETSTPKP